MSLASLLLAAAPSLPVDVAERAASALACARREPQVLLVADLTQPASARRLWALDLARSRLILRDWVSHGAGSDPDRDGVASAFSNTPESHQSSPGLYLVAEPYDGSLGASYRLDGLSPGFNDNARERAVVLHPSEHVRPGWAGRSQGCPSVRHEVIERLAQVSVAGALLWVDAGAQHSPGCGVCPS